MVSGMANAANTAGNLKNNNKKSFPVFVRERFAGLGRAGPLTAWEKVSQLGWEEEPAPSHRLPPRCYQPLWDAIPQIPLTTDSPGL